MSATRAPAPIVSHQGPETNGGREEVVETVFKLNEGLKLASEKSFIWPEGNRPDLPHDNYDSELPVIDLSPVLKLESLRKEIEQLPEGESATRSRLMEEIEASEAANTVVAKAIRAACEEYGFFQIINHGCSMEVVDQFRKLCLHIFDLPDEEKRSIKQVLFPKQPPVPAYTGMKEHNAFTRQNPAYIWSEGLDIQSPGTKAVGTGDVGDLIWSGEPETSRLFRSTTEEYAERSIRIMYWLMDLIAASLAIPKDSLENILGDKDNRKLRTRFRVNHYPICTHPDMTWGLTGHTDPSVLTLVHQGDIGGLQIRYRDGTWHGVQPVPGAFVVNCGDHLQAWTNGRFLSADHRVVPNETSRRLSVAYFGVFEMNCVISPRPECVNDEHPIRYKPFTTMEYLQALVTLGFSEGRGHLLDKAFGLPTPSLGMA